MSQQPVPPHPNYAPAPPRPGPFADLPGTVTTAAVLGAIAGVVAVIGPVAAVVEYNRTVDAMNSAFTEIDPLAGQVYGGINDYVGQVTGPMHGLLIFSGSWA